MKGIDSKVDFSATAEMFPNRKREQNTITGEVRERLSYTELGNIMLKEAGAEACQSGYQTVDPEWVGRYALQYGDINPDGTLN